MAVTWTQIADLALQADIDLREPAVTPGLWRASRELSSCGLSPADVVFIGSSTTQGRDSTFVEANYVNQTMRKVRGDKGALSLGTFYQGGDYRGLGWTFTGSSSGSPQLVNEGLAMRSLLMAANDTATRTVYGCDQVSVLFAEGSGIGTFGVTIDSGTEITVTPRSSDQMSYSGWWTSPALTRGQHTIKIRAIGATRLMGLYAHDGDSARGVRGWNFGLSGNTSVDYTLSAANLTQLTTMGKVLSMINPALIVYMIGANDYSVGRSGADYLANLREAWKLLRSCCNRGPSLLGVHSYPKLDTAQPLSVWQSYLAAWKTFAADTPNVDYLDMSPHFALSQSKDDRDQLSTDSAHMADLGHQYLAEIVAAKINSRITPASAPATQVADGGWAHPSTLSGLIVAYRASDLTGSDGTKVASWAPYAGLEAASQSLITAATLSQATAANRPTIREHGAGDRKFVEFAPYTTSLGELLQTSTFGSGSDYSGVDITMILVAKVYGGYSAARAGADPTKNGNVFTGKTPKFVYAGAFPDGQLTIGDGSTAAADVAKPWFGHAKRRAFAIRYSGSSSGLFCGDMLAIDGTYGSVGKQSFTLNRGGSHGLPGLTLSGSSAGNTNSMSGEFYEVLAFNRALTDTEILNSLKRLNRDYAFDEALTTAA